MAYGRELLSEPQAQSLVAKSEPSLPTKKRELLL
jgi:hypothetical protein